MISCIMSNPVKNFNKKLILNCDEVKDSNTPTMSATLKMSKNELLEECEKLSIGKCKSKTKDQLVVMINAKKQNCLTHIATAVVPAVVLVKESNSGINVIDLFCGCGGMSKGLTDAGLNIVAGIDIWDKAVESYNQNYSHKAYCHDLTLFPPEKFNEMYNPENKTIDLLVGGPPCQSYSIAGKRDKNDPRNALFMEYVKYLNYFSPKAFIMENVMGMLSKKTEAGENVIDIIMSQLSQRYNCLINKLYASDYGVPQNRRRVIIIGIRKDLNIVPSEPVPTTSSCRIPVKVILLPKDQIPISDFLSVRAIQGILNKKQKSKERGAGFGAQYLNMENPSYTIPARYWKDGYDALVKYNETEIRRLTIVELKRIQSFPDDYIITGSKKDIIMQIGNAVACKFAYHLGQHIISILQQSTHPKSR